MLRKERHGDRNVEIAIPDLGEWAGNALGSQKVKGVYKQRAVRCSGTTLEDLGVLAKLREQEEA